MGRENVMQPEVKPLIERASALGPLRHPRLLNIHLSILQETDSIHAVSVRMDCLLHDVCA